MRLELGDWTFNNTAVQMANSINAVLLHETLKQRTIKGRDILTQIAQQKNKQAWFTVHNA